MSKHTPGPWKLETVKTQSGHCHKIGEFPSGSLYRKITSACVYVDGIGLEPRDRPELLANARLIAAAPEMIEALEASVACGLIPITSAREGGAARFSEQVRAADMVRAAIAKAKGESKTLVTSEVKSE